MFCLSMHLTPSTRLTGRQPCGSPASLATWMLLLVQHLQRTRCLASRWFHHIAVQQRGSDTGRPSLHGVLCTQRPAAHLLAEGHSKVAKKKRWTQAWYADDANCGGFLDSLFVWFQRLLQDGPAFGYHPQPSKTCLVVDERDLPEARRLFEPLGVNITCSRHLLGGHVGSSEGRSAYVEEKVKEWVEHLAQLSAAAVRLPQDAYAAVTKSLSQEWNYIQRVIPECGPALSPLEKAISEGFLPNLFGCEISPAERQMFELPVKLAGLGMTNPCVSAPRAYEMSRKATAHLTLAIVGAEELDIATHRESVFNARAEARSSRYEESLRKFDASMPALGERTQRSLRRAKDFSIAQPAHGYLPGQARRTTLFSQPGSYATA